MRLNIHTLRTWLVAFVVAMTVTAAGAARAQPGADALFAEMFEARLAASPQFASSINDKRFHDRWDDPSLTAAIDELDTTIAAFKTLQKRFPRHTLTASQQLSYDILAAEAAAAQRQKLFIDYSYPFNQMFGVHAGLPTFLMNTHKIESRADAESYITRLKGLGAVLDGYGARVQAAAAKGIIAPAFTFDLVINDSRNLISGAPFDGAGDAPLWADATKKINTLDVPPAEKDALLREVRHALMTGVEPAYQRLIATLQALKPQSKGDLGVWALPNGDMYYAERLRYHTSTTLSADEIHAIGLREVARIQGEILAIMTRVDFHGDLAAFFEFTRDDPRFYFPQTPEGRAAYLKAATEQVEAMKAQLPTQFGRLPKADMVVKAVEAFREKSAGLAFYERPSPDGSRPGTYYANLSDMRELPTYEIEALAFHEGVPGHHMQIAIAQENTDMPAFRRHSWVTAYGEGWALYTEELAKEMGFYQDPYADYGRLTMELWRAARLVVDTGIHAKRWSKEQAVQYLVDNTPTTRDASTRAINRYLVMPGQATAYMIGKLKIMELRAGAKARMGTRYDQRAFHDLLLANGPVPLDVLESQVEAWSNAPQR